MKNIMILLCLLLGHFYQMLGQSATVKGRVTSKDNSIGIAYASIGIVNTSIGTICDEFGNFFLQVPKQYLQDSLFISCIGYNTLKSKINISTPINVSLSPRFYLLPEVLISRVLSPEEILEKAKQKMGDNFFQGIYKQQGIYTSTSFKNDKCVGFTQMKLDIFNRGFNWSYTKLNHAFVSITDLANLKERRKSEYFYSKEIRGFYEDGKFYDWPNIVKEDILHKGFLIKGKKAKFSVKIVDTTLYDNELVYVLKCEPNASLLKKINDTPEAYFPTHSGIYEADFYINAKSYAIHKIVFSTKKYDTFQEILQNSKGFEAKWNYVEGVILYEPYQGKYFPKYIMYDESFLEKNKTSGGFNTITKKNQLILTDLGEISGNLDVYKEEFGFEVNHKGEIKRISLKENKVYNEAFWQTIPLELYLSKQSQNDLESQAQESMDTQFKNTSESR